MIESKGGLDIKQLEKNIYETRYIKKDIYIPVAIFTNGGPPRNT